MLTGRRLFTGETISETLAEVLKTHPYWEALPKSVPLSIGRLLRRCLEKDPKRRLQAIGEARVQLEDVLAGAPEETAAAVIPAPSWRRALPWGVSVAALVAALVATTQWAPWRRVLAPAPMRLSAAVGADVSLAIRFGVAISISPDGSTLALVAQKTSGESPQLYVQRLAQVVATPLLGTDNADSPFFSPDSQSIGFFADGKLKKIAVTGGAVVPLCDAPNGRGGAWSEDGTIVFSPDACSHLQVPTTIENKVCRAGTGVSPTLTSPPQSTGKTGKLV
jgi:serine/threonine-protein kinase